MESSAAPTVRRQGFFCLAPLAMSLGDALWRPQGQRIKGSFRRSGLPRSMGFKASRCCPGMTFYM